MQSAGKPYAAARSVEMLTVLAVLSLLMGLVVEIALAWCFGASGIVDAFRVASLILVFGNQLFFGQLLPHVLVPLFLDYRARGLEHEGWRLAFSLAELLGLASLIFAFWVWFDPATLIDLLGPGLTGTSRADAILLIRYFSLAFVLMAWTGTMSGILNVYRVFWVPPAAQLLTNLFVIMAIVTVGREWGGGSLAFGIMLGSLMMFGLHLYFMGCIAKAAGARLSASLKFGPWDGVTKALWLSMPLIIMILAAQWGVIVINRVLSLMPQGTLANFGYAWKLLLLAAILVSSFATVIFPALSDERARNNSAEFSRLATRGIRMSLLLTAPLATLLYVERLPVVTLVLERGTMDMVAVALTSQLFGALLVSTPAGALSVVLHKVAFSTQDAKLPAIIAIISALVLTWLVPYAGKVGGALGVAWAFNLVLWSSTLAMLGYQIGRYRIMRGSEAIKYSGILTALCTGIALPIFAIRSAFEINALASKSMMLLEITMGGLVFIVSGYGLARLLRIHESNEIWRYFRWQMGRFA